MATTVAVIAVAFVATPGAAFAQWKLPEGGTTCFNLIVDAPVEGPVVSATRQTLQEAVSAMDTVYVSTAGANLASGDLVELVRNTGMVRHPATEEHFGHVLEMLGVGEVLDVTATTALVKITGACREIEAGDVIRARTPEVEIPDDLPRLPVFDSNRLVVPEDADAFILMGAVESVKTSSRDLSRKGQTDYEMYGARDIMVLDQGVDTAWELGDVALIYRDRIYADSNIFRGVLTEPPVLGRAVVVRVDGNSAVVQLTDTVEEVQIGDRARNIGNIWDLAGSNR